MLAGRSHLTTLAVAAALCASASLAQADSFLLKSGGRIEGEFLNPKRNSSEPYQVRTSAGVTLSLGKELVAKVIPQHDAQREYERRLPKVPDSAAGHWAMAEWCKEVGLRAQREHHLQEVILREPDHEAAHQALGHQRFHGKWQSPEEHMASQGLVKFQGAWRTRQDIELAKANAAIESKVIEWRQQIRIWRSWLGKKREQEGYANLRAIRDPNAAPALIDLLSEKKQPRDLRMLAVDVLAELPGNPGEQTLIKLAIFDADEGVRDACLDHLVRHQSKSAVFQYIGLLKHEQNLVVQRAATALGRLNDPNATTALIDSLVTIHEILISPGTGGGPGLGPISNTFNNAPDGSINPSGGGFSAGAAKPVKKKVPVQNDAALKALSTLHPGMNFAFDKLAWKQWYVEAFEPPTVNLRRAE